MIPVVLFVYNRPEHTRLTVEALKNNDLASETDLYVFSDSAKHIPDEQSVQAVRYYIRNIKGFHNINIIERPVNFGLSKSIISGVTEIINKRDSIIVLEDDIVPSPGFLKYMNDALNLYCNESGVGCIHAWNYFLNISNYNESTFFLKGADCWGWGTWKRAWDKFNPDGRMLIQILENKGLEFDFNRRNTHPYSTMLKNQIEGKNDSWAIRWHASLVINNMYCLHPTRAIVKNIGFDNSGVHCGEINLEQKTTSFVDVSKIPVEESEWFYKAYSEFFKGSVQITTSKCQKLKTFLKRLLHQ